MTFREQMKQARERKGLSLAKLASLVGVSDRSISFYETGQRNPRLNTEIEICKILEIPLYDKATSLIQYGLTELDDETLKIELRNRGYEIKQG